MLFHIFSLQSSAAFLIQNNISNIKISYLMYRKSRVLPKPFLLVISSMNISLDDISFMTHY